MQNYIPFPARFILLRLCHRTKTCHRKDGVLRWVFSPWRKDTASLPLKEVPQMVSISFWAAKAVMRSIKWAPLSSLTMLFSVLLLSIIFFPTHSCYQNLSEFLSTEQPVQCFHYFLLDCFSALPFLKKIWLVTCPARSVYLLSGEKIREMYRCPV